MRVGLTTKIVALVDAAGDLARFVMLPGQRHDGAGAAPLIAAIEIAARIGGNGFDNESPHRKLLLRRSAGFSTKLLLLEP